MIKIKILLLIICLFTFKVNAQNNNGQFEKIPFGISYQKFHNALLLKKFIFINKTAEGYLHYKYLTENVKWDYYMDSSLPVYINTINGQKLDSCVTRIYGISNTNKKESIEIYNEIFEHYSRFTSNIEFLDKKEIKTCKFIMLDNTIIIIEYLEKQGIQLSYIGYFE